MEFRNNGIFAIIISQRLYSQPKFQACLLKNDNTYESISDSTVLTEKQQVIARLCQECEDRELLKRFTRGEVTMMNMMASLENNKQLEQLFWSYIDKRYAQICQLLQAEPCPVFIKHIQERSLSGATPLQICPTPVAPCYHFALGENGLNYRFGLLLGQEEIPIKAGSHFLALSHQPCVFVLGDTLFCTSRTNNKAIATMAKNGEINVAADKVEVYLNTFVKKVLQTEDAVCTGFDVRTTKTDLRAKLTHTVDTFGKAALQLDFCYGSQTFGFNSEKKHSVVLLKENGRYIFEVCQRDFERENELMELLHRHKVGENGSYLYRFDNGNNLQQLFTEPDITGNFETDSEFELLTDITEGEDWFDVKMVIDTHGYLIPFVKLRRHILKHQTTYTLPDGSVFHIPEEWFTIYNDLFEKAEDNGDRLKLKKHYAGLIADNSDVAKCYIDQMRTNDTLAPQKLNAELRPYQQDGFNYLVNLYNQGYGGCLADDMGLGKTLQFIAFFTHLYGNTSAQKMPAAAHKVWQYHKSEPSLFDQVFDEAPASTTPNEEKAWKPASIVVVPTSVLFNWEKELQKFAPVLHYTTFYGNKRLSNINAHTFDAYHLVLTTYSILCRDADKLGNYQFECAVLDESQNIKNPQSQNHQSAKRLKARSKFVITGTPVENSLNDLWAQMNFACPGLLGNYHAFEETYTAEKPERLTVLKRMVSPFILRRTKSEVCSDLPDLTKIDIWCEMESKEQKAYDAEKSAVRNAILRIGETSTLHILQQLTRLRQMACDPTLLPEYAGLDSIKRAYVVEHAKQIYESDNKVLLFSSFVSQLKQIANDLKKEGIPFDMLTGESSGENRQKIVERFQNDAKQTCLLISLKAGSTGINLTAANYVFLLSPWWNPFVEQQAIDRAYRIGQKNNVTVYNFITKNTVEEKILHLQEKKRKLAGSIIDSENPLQHLSTEELVELI